MQIYKAATRFVEYNGIDKTPYKSFSDIFKNAFLP